MLYPFTTFESPLVFTLLYRFRKIDIISIVGPKNSENSDLFINILKWNIGSKPYNYLSPIMSPTIELYRKVRSQLSYPRYLKRKLALSQWSEST